jgi:hypothetical protein
MTTPPTPPAGWYPDPSGKLVASYRRASASGGTTPAEVQRRVRRRGSQEGGQRVSSTEEGITRKLLVSTAGGMLALGVLWAPLAQGAPMPSDPCDILSNIPTGYAACKADEARDPGFQQRLQQQQQDEVGNCADETAAQTQQCLQQQQIAGNQPWVPQQPWGGTPIGPGGVPGWQPPAPKPLPPVPPGGPYGPNRG